MGFYLGNLPDINSAIKNDYVLVDVYSKWYTYFIIYCL